MGYRIIGKKILARIVEISGLEQLLFCASTEPKVLMYHRIIDPTTVPYPIEDGMYVCPETFQMQMRYLAGNCHVINVDELIAGVIEGRQFLPRTVALTFDDGWVDNYLNAYTVIKEFSLPATIYLATKFIGSADLIWTDKIAVFLQAICRGQTSAESLAKLPKAVPDFGSLTVEIFHNFIESGDYKNLKTSINHVIKFFKSYSEEQLAGIMSVLDACFAEHLNEAGRAFLTWDEVREMATNGISFGCHSDSHFNVTRVSRAQLEIDIARAIARFKEEKVQQSRIFCFPGGYWNEEALQVLKENNYIAAIGATRGMFIGGGCPVIGRVGVHQDISQTLSMFKCRIWSKGIFN